MSGSNEPTGVTETQLPGVGVRHDFETVGGERVAVLTLRSGRRELMVFDDDDPDVCRGLIHLGESDARTLSEVLGASQVTAAVAEVQQIDGLAIDWVTVADTSAHAGETVGEGAFRTRTGVSIIAIVRGDNTIPAPGPEAILEVGDVAVVTGTTDGLGQFRALVAG
jgi:TrkA domain protein